MSATKTIITFKTDFWWEHKELLLSLEKNDKEVDEILRNSPYIQELETNEKWFFRIVYKQIMNGRVYESTKVEASWTLEEIIEWLEHCGRVDEEYASLHESDTIPAFKYFQEKDKEFLKLCKEYLNNKK